MHRSSVSHGPECTVSVETDSQFHITDETLRFVDLSQDDFG